MTRECHVRFCERPGVKFPRPTHHRDGYALWYKRLEQGVFRFPQRNGDRVEVTASELSLLLDGIDLRDVTRRKRYRRNASNFAA